jgi:DnaJ-domain-containing protein 1
MAAADGTVDDDERAVLQSIAEHLGLADNAVEKLLDWTIKGAMWMQEGFDLLNALSE